MTRSGETRQLLIPAEAFDRVAPRLASLPHQLDVLLWSPDGITRPDGTAVPPEEGKPECAWMTLDTLAAGHLAAMVDNIVELGSVRWVQGMLAGIDAPPFRRVQAAGIRLSNSDAPNIGVAEYVMSGMLSVVHGVEARIDSQRTKRWRQGLWPEIGGMRWLIVGFGSIGGEIAQRARPFGVEIVGIRRRAVDDDRADRMATMDGLHAELAEADAVILACPLTEETRGLVDRDFLSAMRPEAILVNVARGPIVDHEALIAALDADTIATAILDVFDVEPLPDDDPLWSHDKVVMTSHVAGAGAGVNARNDQLFIDQLENYLDDRPLRLEV